MRNIVIIMLAVFIVETAAAQTETRIARSVQGKVVNVATNEPVAYTNVGIENTYHGTASDENGNFQLKIPEEMISGSIFFSSVGYQSKKLPVASLFEKEFIIIKLEPQTYDIEDVDIAGRSMVLARILRMASENTPYNFISGPVNLICSLNTEKRKNDSLIVTQQAEVLIYDKTGYRSPSKTDAFTKRTYLIKTDEPAYSFAAGIINFDEILHLDWVRNASSVLNPALSDQFDLTLKGEPVIDGKAAWVIEFSQQDPSFEGSQDFHATSFRGEIVIFKDDYTVKEIKVSAKSKMHNRQGKFLAVTSNNSNYFEDVVYDFSVTYSKLKPERFFINKAYRHNGDQVNEITELKVNSIQVENVKEIAQRNYFPE